MLKYKMDLNLFGIDVPETVKEFNKDNEKLWRVPDAKSSELFQAVYLKGIEERITEMLAHMEEDDFILAMNAIRFSENHLEGIDNSLKSIAANLDLVVRLHCLDRLIAEKSQ